jgi:hypothetical protein
VRNADETERGGEESEDGGVGVGIMNTCRNSNALNSVCICQSHRVHFFPPFGWRDREVESTTIHLLSLDEKKMRMSVLES